MARVTSFRQSLVKTCYSKVLDKFVRIFLVEEETASEFLSALDLAGLTKEEFASTVVQAYLAEPSIYIDLSEDAAGRLTWELYDLILDGNPYLDPDNLEQIEVPTPRKSRKRKPQLDIARSVEIYRKVKDTLEANIVGQREAVGKVISAVGRGVLRSESEVRPICSLFLCGESGVGKTELARQLASALGPESLIKIDCSEYSEAHQIARLTGAPAGYVGYGSPTILERKLRPERMQVLLFDEIEKADRALFNLLLAALEDGTITTSNDEVLRFANCIVLLTSNLGSKELTREHPGFLDVDNKAQAVLSFVRKELPVELVNRLTDIIVFHPLTPEEQERVAVLEFEKLKNNVRHLVTLTWLADAPKGVVGKVAIGRDKGKGGGMRFIRKHMDQIHADIAQQILSGKIQLGVEFQAKGD